MTELPVCLKKAEVWIVEANKHMTCRTNRLGAKEYGIEQQESFIPSCVVASWLENKQKEIDALMTQIENFEDDILGDESNGIDVNGKAYYRSDLIDDFLSQIKDKVEELIAVFGEEKGK